MKVAVIDSKGKDTGRKVELSKEVFGIEPNNHAVYLDVKQYLANQRQGTHKSKERAEITGSTRKIKKQKGTGTARAGSIKSGVFRGGGRMFGPRPRDYSFKLNKNLKRLARKSALSIQANDKNVIVVEDFDFETPKTKNFLDVLKAFELETKKSLIILRQMVIGAFNKTNMMTRPYLFYKAHPIVTNTNINNMLRRMFLKTHHHK